MRDIVETIQAEQDQVIRARTPGCSSCRAAPGTGKTAVALHRAAYLLYTHREQLARRGVLIVGPNADLPALHRAGAAVAGRDRGGAGHGRRAVPRGDRTAGRAAPRSPRSRAGRELAAVLAAAVRDRQRVPDGGLELASTTRHRAAGPRRPAAGSGTGPARSRRPHNEARAVFARRADRRAGRGGREPAGEDGRRRAARRRERDDIRAELRAEPRVWRAIDELWPALTPQRLLTDLLADPDRLAAAAPGLTAAERERCCSARPGGGWTPADVPLLDEAAELLGEDDRAAAGPGRPSGAGPRSPTRRACWTSWPAPPRTSWTTRTTGRTRSG